MLHFHAALFIITLWLIDQFDGSAAEETSLHTEKEKNLFTLDWEYGMDKQAICVSVDCFIFRRVP